MNGSISLLSLAHGGVNRQEDPREKAGRLGDADQDLLVSVLERFEGLHALLPRPVLHEIAMVEQEVMHCRHGFR